MKRDTLKPCSQFGCGALVPGGGRCPRHRPPDLRPSAAARGYGHRWRKVRAKFLREHAACETCGAPATEAHHAAGQGPRGPGGLDPAGLVALCKACHARITARMQPGGWNQPPPGGPPA
jgi:5-methylcytosine-specific restriction protein A